MAEAKIVVVDDEKEIADLITLYLTNETYEVHIFITEPTLWRIWRPRRRIWQCWT